MAGQQGSQLQRQAQAAAQAPAQVSGQEAIKQRLDHYRPVIQKLLAGTGIGEETFIAQVANACRTTPELLRCRPETVLGAALKAAQLGLAPNDARNLCWILPYAGNAQFQLGYGGVMELARRASPGLRFDGRPVFPNDVFDLDWGKAEPLTHRSHIVNKVERGGDAYAWYVRAVYPDGSQVVHVLDREGVEYHRSFSKQANGNMWTKSYDAAALKSVVLDMRRWLPGSPQLVAALAADEHVINPDALDDVVENDDDVAVVVDTATGEITSGAKTEPPPAAGNASPKETATAPAGKADQQKLGDTQ